jgi:hypothetical protein
MVAGVNLVGNDFLFQETGLVIIGYNDIVQSVEINEKPHLLIRSIGAIYTKGYFEIKQKQLQIVRF